MIWPSGLMLFRPGMFIPVFFLVHLQVSVLGQVQWTGSTSAALGGSFVCLDGPMCSGLNQAGLGFAERSSVTIQHGRPFMLKDLGISALSGQMSTGEGALGVWLSTMGLRGLRQSSFWLAFGRRLHPRISAGVGLHGWNTSVRDQLFYAPGISFALGLQAKINEAWRLGARVFHPASWTRRPAGSAENSTSIETGFAYSFFKVARLYAELHVKPGLPLILCGGAQWTLNRFILFRTGIRSSPFTFSWGMRFRLDKCMVEFSCMYNTLTGWSPSSALTYEW